MSIFRFLPATAPGGSMGQARRRRSSWGGIKSKQTGGSSRTKSSSGDSFCPLVTASDLIRSDLQSRLPATAVTCNRPPFAPMSGEGAASFPCTLAADRLARTLSADDKRSCDGKSDSSPANGDSHPSQHLREPWGQSPSPTRCVSDATTMLLYWRPFSDSGGTNGTPQAK
jgi:hypothetical protein